MTSSDMPAPSNDGQLHDAPGLELPDWSGMAPRQGRMAFEEAVQWNEDMLAMFPQKPNRAGLDADAKCYVEFSL